MMNDLPVIGLRWWFDTGLDICIGLFQYNPVVHEGAVMGYGCIPLIN